MSSHYENVNNINIALEAANKKKKASSLISCAVYTIKKVLRKLTKSKCKKSKVAPAVFEPKPVAPAPLSPEELENLINEALEEQSAALLLVVSPDSDLRRACGFSLQQTPTQQSPTLPHCCDIMISSSFSLHQLPTMQTPVSDYYYY